MYYVYKTTNIVNNKIYVGVHKSDNIQSDQYLGSGDALILSTKKYGRDKFIREVLYEYENQMEAYFMQSQIVDKQFVKRKDTYNIKCGGLGGMTGKIPVKDQNGITFHVFSDDERYLSGQLKHNTTGQIVVQDLNGNILSTTKQDPRYLSGQLVGLNKGKVIVKDKEGNIYRVDKNDPKYLSGQLVGNQKGFIIAKDPNGIIARVSKDDPRYLSGQLVGVNKGNKMPKNHAVGNKNSQYGTIWVTNGKQNKKIKKDNNIPQGWRRGRKLK